MTPAKADDLLAVARVLRTHGVRGEVSVELLAPPVVEPAEVLFERPLHVRASGRETASRIVVCESIRPHQDRWLLAFEGIETMDEAETLKGHDLCLMRRELPELPEGWYWEADLLQCKVIDAHLGELGVAAGLDLNAQQPQLLIERKTGQQARIPWVRAYIKCVDPEKFEIHTDLPAEFPGISD